MPKSIQSPDAGREGLEVMWTPTALRLDLIAWYDSFVGIEPWSMTLAEFFGALGITEAHCRRAFNQLDREALEMEKTDE